MKDKAYNSPGGEKDEFNQAYKLYADYDFQNDETRHPRCKNVADYVPCTPTYD